MFNFFVAVKKNTKSELKHFVIKINFFFLVKMTLDDIKTIKRITLFENVYRRKRQHRAIRSSDEIVDRNSYHLIKKDRKRRRLVPFSNQGACCVIGKLLEEVRLNAKHNFTNRKRTCEGDQCITL